MRSPAQGRLPIRPSAALSSLRLVAEVYGECGEEQPSSVYVRQAADLLFADGQNCRVYGLTVPEVQVRPRATRRNTKTILNAARRDLEPLSAVLAALPLGLHGDERTLIQPNALAGASWELRVLEN